MFKKKKEEIQALQCTTDKNTNECSIVAEIHKLQERKEVLNNELKELEAEINSMHIPVNPRLGQELNYPYYYIGKVNQFSLDLFANYCTSDQLYEISLKLNKLAQLKERPECIKDEISRINVRLNELKEQLDIR